MLRQFGITRPHLLLIFFLRLVSGFLDVTLVVNKPIATYDEDASVKCVADLKYFNRSTSPFTRNIDVGVGKKIPEKSIYGNIAPEAWPGKQLILPQEAGPLKFGFISCNAFDDETDQATTVTGLIMSKTALVFPNKLNYRTQKNEAVTLSVVQARRRRINDLVWYHLTENRRPQLVAQAKLSYSIGRPQRQNSGSYVIFHRVRDKFVQIFQQGLTRLLVRNCEVDKYGDNCGFDCPLCENGAICDDKNGVCICPPGFKGELCEIECGSNKFGADCQYNCSEDAEIGCKGKLFCLPDPYGCSCATGFSGTICTYDCPRGMYGESCALACHCQQNKCDPFTGNCTYGCAAGWTGRNCQKSCENGTFGANCNETCGFCAGNKNCDRFSGSCPETNITSNFADANSTIAVANEVSFCLIGYEPPLCKKMCSNGTWGLDCLKQCHCLNNASCAPENGFCPLIEEGNEENICDTGWRGRVCNKTCEDGFFGDHCKSKCGKCINQTACHHVNGDCVVNSGECERGYQPPHCSSFCSKGFFGANCSKECNCGNGTECDPVTGECEGLCLTGWTGLDCYEVCPPGTFGLNCSEKCGHCKEFIGERLCDPMIGKCIEGCTRTWMGDQCMTGLLCAQNPCFNDGTCQQTDDIYRCHCSDAYSGSRCEVTRPPCSSDPCLNNGTCTKIDENEFKCNCTKDYEGDICETLKEEEKDEEDENGSDEQEENNNTEESNNSDHVDDDNDDDETEKDSWPMLSILLPYLVVLLFFIFLSAILIFKHCRKPTSTVRPVTENIQSSFKPVDHSVTNDTQLNNNSEVAEDNWLQSNSDMKQDESFSEEESNTSNSTITESKYNDFKETKKRALAPSVDFNQHEFQKNPFSPPPKPPNGSFKDDDSSITLKRETGNQKVSRPSMQLRYNKENLNKLNEIGHRNFNKNSNNTSFPEKTDNLKINNNNIIRQSDVECDSDSWESASSKHSDPSSTIYGVPRKDTNLLITSSRDAEEEFEMESRKGPTTEKKKFK